MRGRMGLGSDLSIFNDWDRKKEVYKRGGRKRTNSPLCDLRHHVDQISFSFFYLKTHHNQWATSYCYNAIF